MAFLPQPRESAEPEDSEETIVTSVAASARAIAAAEEDNGTIDVHTTRGATIRYLPLDHLYSATSPCSGSSNVMSKKVKARKLTPHFHQNDDVSAKTNSNNNNNDGGGDAENVSTASSVIIPPNNFDSNDDKPPLVFVYSRRRKRGGSGSTAASFYDLVSGRVEKDPAERAASKKRKIGTTELEKLGVDLGALGVLDDGPRLRECRIGNNDGGGGLMEKLLSESRTVKTWVGLSFDNADPEAFIGLRCKVFWPMDIMWYAGHVKGYDMETKIHHVEYDDGDEENLILSNENVKFHISREEMKRLNLSYGKARDSNDSDCDAEEMLAMAASLDDCQQFEPRDIASEEVRRDYEERFSQMFIMPPKHLTKWLLSEDKYPEFWRLIDIQGLRGFLFTRERYYPRLVAAAYATLSIQDNLDENGAGDFQLSFRLGGAEYAFSLNGLASIWELQNGGTTFKGGNSPHRTWGEFDRLEAMRDLRLEHASSGKFAVGKMTMDHRLLHYMLSYVLLPRKGNHGTANEEDLIILWAMVKEKLINWPYLIANKMLKYTTGRANSSLGHAMLWTEIFEHLHFDLSREEVGTLGKKNAITNKNIN